MYKVIVDFKDLTDGHIYRAGDPFPRSGATVSQKRAKELMSKKNLRGVPLIEKVVIEDADGSVSGTEELVR